MSTSPRPPASSAAVFTPLPSSRAGVDSSATAAAFASHDVAHASQASGYAAGWAQGVAAAAEEERRVIAALQARAAAEREALRAQVVQAIASLGAAADELRARTTPQLDAVADAVAIAVVDLAEVVIGREIADDGMRGLTALRRALDAAPTHADITVRLNPDDLAVVEEMHATEGLLALADGQVTVLPDPRLAPGDAFAEFPGGLVDARTDTALARIRGQMRGAARPAQEARA
ncbi:FliH/SctL family protein [Quadrisphaera sp. KR29]|uniref:FliH/SctL family protein n=1 Tax=Quadrisphaera sp. KR29 TaxID=3461391 RepID=UPI004043CD9E